MVTLEQSRPFIEEGRPKKSARKLDVSVGTVFAAAPTEKQRIRYWKRSREIFDCYCRGREFNSSEGL
jgi:hypothetical protein